MATQQDDIYLKVLSFQGAGIYQICLQGILDERWFSGLGDIRRSTSQSADGKPVTTLTGRFRDQANLLGLLNTIYDLHLPLIKVEYLAAPSPHNDTSDPKDTPL